MAKPRVTGTTHELPFEKLSPRDFERICLWLVRREGYPTAEHHGAAGTDRGRDLVAQREEGLAVFQCKREKHFGPAKAEEAVRKIMAEEPTPTEIILQVACDVSADTRQEAAEGARNASGEKTASGTSWIRASTGSPNLEPLRWSHSTPWIQRPDRAKGQPGFSSLAERSPSSSPPPPPTSRRSLSGL